MGDFTSKLFDFLKLSPRSLGGIALATGMLLFLDVSTLDIIGVGGFASEAKTIVGLTFLLAICLLVTYLLDALWPRIRDRVQARAELRKMQARLGNLTTHEKAILLSFMRSGSRTRAFDIQDGAVAGLVNERILYRASGFGTVTSFDFNLQVWAWDHLKKHPHLLGDINGAER